jgi:FtsP/CotA-like multicopper oxidase with cupredoxin domain
VRSAALLLVLGAAATACGDDARGGQGGAAGAGGGNGGHAPSRQPAGWDDALRLARPVDLDPDPGVLEIDLVAKVEEHELIAGTTTPAWTYDGHLPGPLLELTAGDRLVVHFRNELPAATTIHWHGLRVPADQDGALHDGMRAVEPGETFEYAFEVPDAGLYWYHPHVDSAAQVGFGLYGAILVHPRPGGGPGGPAEPEGLGDEVVLVLSDMGLEEDGSLRDPQAGGDLGMLFGREGDLVLVNGKAQPRLGARAGLRQRWRIVNAAKSRYALLDLPGHRFTRIGGDGGLLEAPIEEERLFLTPGQRVDVVVQLEGEPGAELPLRWIPYDRGYGTFEFRDPIDVMTVAFDEAPREEDAPMPTWERTIDVPDPAGATAVEVALTQGKDAEGHTVLGIDGVPFWDAEPLVAHVGERQVWTVVNEMDWDHPFHLHGFFFHEVDEAGLPLGPRELRDTVNVPQHETRHFIVEYDDRPGMWMFHCHILDHAEAGMMGMLHLEP